MRRVLSGVSLSLLALAVVLGQPAPGLAQGGGATVGQPAPEFTLPDMHGKEFSLADLKGSWVVLEWMSYDCPFVKKFYVPGAFQKMQEDYAAKGVKWLSVVSSAPGNPGHRTPEAMVKESEEYGHKALAVLLDPSGTVGRSYGAQTTPHMFVINPEGVLIYNGAIDDKPSSRSSDIAAAHNYVAAALDEAMAGKPVTVSLTKPYG